MVVVLQISFIHILQTCTIILLKWDLELLSDKTNIEVINTAKCGIGNERIFHGVIREIFNNENIERVIVAWTEWTRQDS